MKLKLDLHPIYNDSQQIEASLGAIIDEAIAKRVKEVEVIPGKGSGALKKTVIRFLDRPDIKIKYHRIEKDSDNWGRLFIHFHTQERDQAVKQPAKPVERVDYRCFCCDATVSVIVNSAELLENGPEERVVECPSCSSPNKLTIRTDRNKKVSISAESGYE
jgi:DNA-directed RNA polymerase subunit RPC12/RpoP